MFNDVTKEMLILKNVLYTPHFHKNIVSIGKFVQDGQYEVDMRTDQLILKKIGYFKTLNFKRDNNNVLYYFTGKRIKGENVMSAVVPDENANKVIKMNIMEAHAKYGHVSEAALRTTLKHLGIQVTGHWKSCEGCALAKA